jgi:branched-chain amino acid transport system permease protein
MYKWVLWVVGLIILAIFPQVTGIYYTNVFVGFAIFALYAVTLNLLLGYNGLLSFGHAMFFGTGAYATALALTHIQGFPLLPAVLVGGMAGALLALILSPLLVKVSGTAFAMLTLAFGQLIFVLALKYREITGGEDGIGGYPIPPLNIPGIGSIDMTVAANLYYFAVVVIVLCLWFLWFYTKTPFGSLVVGIRDNAMRVDYLGFKLPQTRAINLIVAGGFAGIAGAIYALLQNLVSTLGVLDIGNSFSPILMVYIGGVGSFFGPIVGSGILHLLEDLVIRFTDRIWLVNGAIFILVVLYAPMGLVGLFHAAKAKWFYKEKAS